MKTVKIENLQPGVVEGLIVELGDAVSSYHENYFIWEASDIVAEQASNAVSGGVLKVSPHQPVFHQAETHIDSEKFFFVKGTVLMYFVQFENGKPVMDTSKIVRIKEGTRIIIPAGLGHFVPVADGESQALIVISAPPMDADRTDLPIAIIGK